MLLGGILQPHESRNSDISLGEKILGALLSDRAAAAIDFLDR